MIETDKVLALIHTIATEAMILGKDVVIEQKEYYSDTKGFGASIGGGHSEDTGIVLRVFQQEEGEEDDDD